jgi:carbohydrate kinase (thermoresistant glucokinase family)
MIYLVMGVSGCGKTCIGALLAEKLALPFHDADDFHSPTNIEKMKSGIPLNDTDRSPWLQTLSEKIPGWQSQGGAVLACSALKKQYRTVLKKAAREKMYTIYLKGSYNLILSRMKKRKHEYFKEDLLASQFVVLEEPENALTIPINITPYDIVNKILQYYAACG